MTGSEKEGCMFRRLHYVHSSEVCEARACMICNEGLWEPSVEIYETEIMQKMPLESEPEGSPVIGCEDKCELDGKLHACSSVICESGECRVCFKGKWLSEKDFH